MTTNYTVTQIYNLYILQKRGHFLCRLAPPWYPLKSCVTYSWLPVEWTCKFSPIFLIFIYDDYWKQMRDYVSKGCLKVFLIPSGNCGDVSPSRHQGTSKLRLHVESVHEKVTHFSTLKSAWLVSSVFECESCVKRSARSRESLRNHMESVHGTIFSAPTLVWVQKGILSEVAIQRTHGTPKMKGLENVKSFLSSEREDTLSTAKDRG